MRVLPIFLLQNGFSLINFIPGYFHPSPFCLRLYSREESSCRSSSFSGNFLPHLGSQVDFHSALWYLACLSLPSHSAGGSDGKESACSAGDIRDPGFIPGSERSPGEGRGNPLQNSCLENSMDRGAWWATVHGVAKSQT